MKRRIFIRNTALTGLGVGLVGIPGCSTPSSESSATAEAIAGVPQFKLSLAQWSIHNMIQKEGLDPYEFAAKAKGWEFQGLEFVSQLYKEDIKRGATVSSGLDAMVKELNLRSNDTGMENLLMMVDLDDTDGDMAVTDATLRNKAIENHYPYIDATAALGCHSVRINMFGEFDAESWKPAAVEALGTLGEYAAKSNVNVIIENHGWLTSNAELLMEVINEVDLPNCGTLPDFGNFCTKRKDMSRWGECEEEYDKYLGIQQLMPAAKAVSAKSYDFNEDGFETTIDYKRMIDIVTKAGYSGHIGVEYEGERLSEEEGIIATRDLLIQLRSELA